MCVARRCPVLLMSALVLLVACTSGTGPEDKDRLDLTAEDNGTHVRMSVGDILTISLDENPSMGAHWEASDMDPDIMQYLDETFEVDPACEPGAVGCGGTLKLRFAAVGGGETVLRLAYRRAGDNATLDTFLVTLTVKN